MIKCTSLNERYDQVNTVYCLSGRSVLFTDQSGRFILLTVPSGRFIGQSGRFIRLIVQPERLILFIVIAK